MNTCTEATIELESVRADDLTIVVPVSDWHRYLAYAATSTRCRPVLAELWGWVTRM